MFEIIRRHRRATFAPSLLVLALLLPGDAPAKQAGDAVPVVHNGATPPGGREILRLEEKWRIGGDDEDGILLGMVSEVRGDEDGNVYVMDSQLCQVHAFSPGGELLRTMFRQGEGPGEVLRPRDMIVTKDGVGLAEEFPGKLVMVDREGLPLDTARIGGVDNQNGMYAISAATAGGGNIVLGSVTIKQGEVAGTQDRKYCLISVARDGREIARYWESDAKYDFNNFRFEEKVHSPSPWWGHAVGADGRVYAVLDYDRYAVSVFAADGTPLKVIEREHEPYRRSGGEMKWIRGLFENAVSMMRVPVELVIEDNEPAIDYWRRGLRVADDGSLWVLSSRGLRDRRDGALLTYDVFDAEGRFARQVAVVCEGDSFYDSLFWINDEEVVLVKGALAAMVAQFGPGAAQDGDEEEATPQEVVCYRVIR